MHEPLRLLICTTDPQGQLALQGYAENHPDVTGFQVVGSWKTAVDIAAQYDLILVEEQMLPSPDALQSLLPHISVILLAADPNDCRRFRGSPVRGCLIAPVSFEAFQWTIRSMQPMYATDTA